VPVTVVDAKATGLKGRLDQSTEEKYTDNSKIPKYPIQFRVVVRS